MKNLQEKKDYKKKERGKLKANKERITEREKEKERRKRGRGKR